MSLRGRCRRRREQASKQASKQGVTEREILYKIVHRENQKKKKKKY